jgi:acetate kinase
MAEAASSTVSDTALCLNAGSSSLKFALFRVDETAEESLAVGVIEGIGTPSARATLTASGKRSARPCPNTTAEAGLGVAFELLDEASLPTASVVGHRIVHGGQAHLRPVLIDAALIASLKELVPLAPLHLPAGILGIEAAMARLPGVRHVACFDTSFHATMPEYAARFALPWQLYDEGVRRYGFHGLSYEYVLSTLREPVPGRIIVAHLGNGASLAAIKHGRSVDTTMGFTPAGGIMMGTRAGDLDPGLLLYLLREKGFTAQTLETLVDRESGLLGVAGSADLRVLTEHNEHAARAQLAIQMMGYAVRKAIGAYVAVLGGLDLLVFTGGIGEHSPEIRAEACRDLGALGITLDEQKNTLSEREIHAPGSCPIQVVADDEDRIIARHAGALIRSG